jgi:hypothetical protein
MLYTVRSLLTGKSFPRDSTSEWIPRLAQRLPSMFLIKHKFMNRYRIGRTCINLVFCKSRVKLIGPLPDGSFERFAYRRRREVNLLSGSSGTQAGGTKTMLKVQLVLTLLGDSLREMTYSAYQIELYAEITYQL